MSGVIVISSGQDGQEVVSVVSKSQYEKMQGQEQSENEKMDEEANTAAEDSFEMIPREGDLVYGRINKIEDRFARVDILAIEDRPLQGNTHFTGMIFKENVRDYDRDAIQMHRCFAPNDIIKARVK